MCLCILYTKRILKVVEKSKTSSLLHGSCTKTRRSNFGLKMSGLKFYLTLCPGIWSCSFSSCFFVEQASDNLLTSPRWDILDWSWSTLVDHAYRMSAVLFAFLTPSPIERKIKNNLIVALWCRLTNTRNTAAYTHCSGEKEGKRERMK